MGGCFSSSKNSGGSISGLATAVSLEIATDAETVWEVVSDLDAIAQVVSQVQSFERIDGGGETFAVGTKWREMRSLNGGKNTFEQIKTIIGLNTHYPYYSMSLNISYPNKSSGKMEDVTNTSTLTVQAIDDNLCVLVCSLSFGTGDRGFYFLCGRCIMKAAEKYVMEELQDYAKEALKRDAKNKKEKIHEQTLSSKGEDRG